MNDHLSAAEMAQVRAVIEAIAEAIKDLGSVPSGHLYAGLMSRMSIQTYEEIISLLVNQGRVRREATHLLVWVGGKK